MYIPFAFENNAFPIEFTFAIDYLIVGGGGCGGKGRGGGGGGGGFVSGSQLFTSSLNPNLTSSLNYPIVVGLGGVTSSVSASGGNGGTSSFNNLIALGGGGGGGFSGSAAATEIYLPGVSGGSGGGGGFRAPTNRTGGAGLQPSSLSGGFGNNGGTGKENVGQAGGAGGGGGAGAAGSDATTGDFINYNPGPGGAGKIWLDGTYYAGGGGGAGDSSGAAGGIGGGGTGGKVTLPQVNPTKGTNGLGGGGGGGAGTFEPTTGKGEGGSGVVKLRYLTNPFYNITGGTITQSGGYTYHTFLSSSTFTINKVS